MSSSSLILLSNIDFKEHDRQRVALWRKNNPELAREVVRRYRAKHRQEARDYTTAYRQVHREECRQASNDYKSRHKDEVRQYNKQWFESHPTYQKRMRLMALHILGDKCAECGFSDMRILNIHHINGDGKLDKNKNLHGMINRQPEEARKRLQLLCPNCHAYKHLKESEK